MGDMPTTLPADMMGLNFRDTVGPDMTPCGALVSINKETSYGAVLNVILVSNKEMSWDNMYIRLEDGPWYNYDGDGLDN